MPPAVTGRFSPDHGNIFDEPSRRPGSVAELAGESTPTRSFSLSARMAAR
ncbi:MAG TPA: hypothetical protein VEL05_08935 [Candidatus Acidoferrum sp.]|nr:hypothetical protein [Candidatus Acidoferrum sp.]